ncbi:MAG: 23S rRNA (uracil(1939)-C(5))-methyltransferase RlmD [Thermostichales cyanobacterium BF4_bins_65]
MVALAGTLRDLCPVVDRCGGCLWGSLTYAEQVARKQAQLVQTLGEGGWPLLAAAHPYGYRNRAIYPVQPGFRLGLYAANSHEVIPVDGCPVHDPRLDQVLAQVRADLPATGWIPYDEHRQTGNLRYLSARLGRRTGECLLTLVVRDPDLPGIDAWAEAWLGIPGVVGVGVNVNPEPGNSIWGSTTYTVAGTGMIQEIMGGLTFALDGRSFFQAHTEQAEALFTWALEQLPPVGSAVDAYCGVGTLALLLAHRDPQVQVTGLEVVPQAIERAELNSLWNGISGIRWCCAAVESCLWEWLPVELLILDPPRKGCHPQVIQVILAQPPRWILYISCHLPSLLRDLRQLVPPYRLWQWRGADLFPQTPHLETAVILQLCP